MNRRILLLAALLLLATSALGCAALAQMGGVEFCISTPGHAAASASVMPSAVATVVPSASASAGAL